MNQKPDSRITALDSFRTHPIYKVRLQRLSVADSTELRLFIKKNDHLGHLEFEYAVNRMHLDQPTKSKNWAIIQELAMSANAAVHVDRNLRKPLYRGAVSANRERA